MRSAGRRKIEGGTEFEISERHRKGEEDHLT